MAVAASNAVPLIVSNFGDLYPDGSTEVAATTALHPQKPELGSRVMRRAARLLLEPEDCVALREGEEVTLLRWGNFIIEKIVRESGGDAGPVSSITVKR